MALWSIDRILGTEKAPVQRAQPKTQPRSFSRADKGKGRAIWVEPYHVPTQPTVVPASTIAPPSVLADVTNGFPHSSTDRFLSPYLKEELDHLCRQSNNNWATCVFKTWVAARNQLSPSPDDTLPEDLLEVRHPLDVQDRTLAAFVLEARRADGNYYPGSTLKNIIAALFRVMKANQGAVNVVSFAPGKRR